MANILPIICEPDESQEDFMARFMEIVIGAGQALSSIGLGKPSQAVPRASLRSPGAPKLTAMCLMRPLVARPGKTYQVSPRSGAEMRARLVL